MALQPRGLLAPGRWRRACAAANRALIPAPQSEPRIERPLAELPAAAEPAAVRRNSFRTLSGSGLGHALGCSVAPALYSDSRSLQTLCRIGRNSRPLPIAGCGK